MNLLARTISVETRMTQQTHHSPHDSQSAIQHHALDSHAKHTTARKEDTKRNIGDETSLRY